MAGSGLKSQRPLVVCPVQLGDFVFSLPTLSALAGHFKEELGVVADPGTAGLLELIHQEVQAFVFDPRTVFFPGKPGGLPSKLKEGFDSVLLLGRHREMRRLLEDVAFRQSRIATFDQFDGDSDLHSHLARRFYHFAELSLAVDFPAFPETPAIRGKAFRSHQPAASRYVVVHPGNSSSLRPKRFWSKSKTRHRAWPVRSWIELVERLCSDFAGRIVLSGSRGEAALTTKIVRGLSGPASRRVENRAGETSVGELALLLAGADLYIGVDTGPTHLASILGTRTIALFGPTDPQKVGPLENGNNLRVLRTGIQCSPCSRAVRKKCAVNRCLTELTPKRVLEAAGEWLS